MADSVPACKSGEMRQTTPWDDSRLVLTDSLDMGVLEIDEAVMKSRK